MILAAVSFESSLVLITSVALDVSVGAGSSFVLASPEEVLLEILSTITFGRFRRGSA